jgi:hypothetical protein
LFCGRCLYEPHYTTYAAMRSKRSLDPATVQQRADHSGMWDEAQVRKRMRLEAHPSLSDNDAATQEQATSQRPLQHCLNAGATPAPLPLPARPRRAAAQAAGARISRCAAAEARHRTPGGREDDGSSAATSHGSEGSDGGNDGSSGSDPDARGLSEVEDKEEDEGGASPEPRERRRAVAVAAAAASAAAAAAAAASPRDGDSTVGQEGALWQTVRGAFNHMDSWWASSVLMQPEAVSKPCLLTASILLDVNIPLPTYHCSSRHLWWSRRKRITEVAIRHK